MFLKYSGFNTVIHVAGLFLGFFLRFDFYLTLAISHAHGSDKTGGIVRVHFFLGTERKCHTPVEWPVCREGLAGYEGTAPDDDHSSIVSHLKNLFF